MPLLLSWLSLGITSGPQGVSPPRAFTKLCSWAGIHRNPGGSVSCSCPENGVLWQVRNGIQELQVSLPGSGVSEGCSEGSPPPAGPSCL